MKVLGINPRLARFGRWFTAACLLLPATGVNLLDYSTWSVFPFVLLTLFWTEAARARDEGRTAGFKEGVEVGHSTAQAQIEKAFVAGQASSLLDRIQIAITPPPSAPPPAGSA